MVETTDQIFVTLKHWLVGFAPHHCQPIISVIISVAGIIIVFVSLFAITTVLERKGLGRIFQVPLRPPPARTSEHFRRGQDDQAAGLQIPPCHH